MEANDTTDEELIMMALQMWANRIETGNPDLSAQDCLAMKRKVEALTPGAMERVLRLRGLANQVPVDADKLGRQLSAQFHRLWGMNKDGVYVKNEWMEMQRLLQARLRCG